MIKFIIIGKLQKKVESIFRDGGQHKKGVDQQDVVRVQNSDKGPLAYFLFFYIVSKCNFYTEVFPIPYPSVTVP